MARWLLATPSGADGPGKDRDEKSVAGRRL